MDIISLQLHVIFPSFFFLILLRSLNFVLSSMLCDCILTRLRYICVFVVIYLHSFLLVFACDPSSNLDFLYSYLASRFCRYVSGSPNSVPNYSNFTFVPRDLEFYSNDSIILMKKACRQHNLSPCVETGTVSWTTYVPARLWSEDPSRLCLGRAWSRCGSLCWRRRCRWAPCLPCRTRHHSPPPPGEWRSSPALAPGYCSGRNRCSSWSHSKQSAFTHVFLPFVVLISSSGKAQ